MFLLVVYQFLSVYSHIFLSHYKCIKYVQVNVCKRFKKKLFLFCLEISLIMRQCISHKYRFIFYITQDCSIRCLRLFKPCTFHFYIFFVPTNNFQKLSNLTAIWFPNSISYFVHFIFKMLQF